MKEIRKELRSEINKDKQKYRKKIEAELGNSNLRTAWQGIKTMRGSHDRGSRKVRLNGFNSDIHLADELNAFYLRFDNNDFSSDVNNIKLRTRTYLAVDIDVQSV